MSDVEDGWVPLCALTRRGFVGASAGVLVMGCGGPKKMKAHPVTPDASGMIEIEINKHAELAAPGGMLALAPKGKKQLLVMRLEGDQFRALSMKCTHLGCTVRWDNTEQQLRCPCHGSRFADDGKVVKGPAKQGLAQYPTNLLGTKLQISVREG